MEKEPRPKINPLKDRIFSYAAFGVSAVVLLGLAVYAIDARILSLK